MPNEHNYVNLIGNLVEDPELRYTPSGAAVCNFRIASNRKWTGRDGQQQEDTTFMTVNCWRDLAEHVAETLHKGDRAIVVGRLRVRSYDDAGGQTKWVTEVEADEVAPSLRWAKAQVERSNGGGRTQSAPPTADDDVPF